MDNAEIKLECLKLATEHHIKSVFRPEKPFMQTANEYYAFVTTATIPEKAPDAPDTALNMNPTLPIV